MSDTDLTLEPEPAERDDATVDIFGAPTEAQGASAAPAAAAPAPYTVIARKYRPRTFEDLIGQEAMVRTLTNAFATGRIAHAFMLTGVRGVGKTTTARLLARALNYESGTVHAPSLAHLAEEGRHCRAILEGRHLDVLELDAASRTGIDDIRELTESVRYAPAEARYKVYILDEIHMLSEKAFNALLKTLEEPPPHAKFIFATTEIRKVPVTILSRCQRFDLRRVEPEVIAANLAAIARAEGVGVEPDALTLIARAAEGSVRDAQSLLDQALVQAGDGERVGADAVRDMLGLSDRALTIALLETLAQGQGGPAITAFRELHALGADPATVVMDLLEHCHAASVAKTLGPEALRLPREQAARLTALGTSLSAGTLSRLWQMLLKGLEETRSAPDPAAAVDMLLIRLAFAADLPGPEEALRAIREGGAVPAGGGGTRRPAGGGTTALAAQPAPMVEARQALAGPRSFQDVVQLAEAHRDISLKFDIERYVRPISFRMGAIEFEPAPGAPSNLQQRLVARLKEWTGQPWLVATETRGGSETLDELHKQALTRAHGEVLADPFVKAVLDAFPGTEILEVRDLAVPQVVAPDPEPSEEE
ncbi:MAG: DNA polymerase III subunit gamma/tau [Caulobacteraceae bacterium]|nr:DNA polymerase III subunit gamma/tau [Caulobacteraceae bacterium]